MSKTIYYGCIEFEKRKYEIDGILALYKATDEGLFIYDNVGGWDQSRQTTIEAVKKFWGLIELKSGVTYNFVNREPGIEWKRIQLIDTKLGKLVL